METKVSSTEQTKKLAQQIANKLVAGDVIALYGDLGVGKTTFTRYLVESLGIKARVQSPTFVISRKYENTESDSKIKYINHLDLYRINDIDEIEDLGLEDYVNDSNAITIIEWPEIAENYLGNKTIRIYFEELGIDERKVSIHNLY